MFLASAAETKTKQSAQQERYGGWLRDLCQGYALQATFINRRNLGFIQNAIPLANFIDFTPPFAVVITGLRIGSNIQIGIVRIAVSIVVNGRGSSRCNQTAVNPQAGAHATFADGNDVMPSVVYTDRWTGRVVARNVTTAAGLRFTHKSTRLTAFNREPKENAGLNFTCHRR